jgi:hypothetical protein
MGWKYIMIEDKLTRTPIIFPDKLVHQEVFVVCRELWLPARGPVTACSAGMIEFLDVDGVGGKSETLRIKSHDRDAEIINGYPYSHGIK